MIPVKSQPPKSIKLPLTEKYSPNNSHPYVLSMWVILYSFYYTSLDISNGFFSPPQILYM